MRYLLFWDISSAEPKDHQILGGPHGATILDRIMKMKQQPPPPPQKKSQNAPFSHPCLEGRRYKFRIYSYEHRRQHRGILDINYSRRRDEIPAPGSSVPRTLVRAKPR